MEQRTSRQEQIAEQDSRNIRRAEGIARRWDWAKRAGEALVGRNIV